MAIKGAVGIFTPHIESHDVLITGQEYSGDHHEMRPHLDIPDSVLASLGWDFTTYLSGTILDGKIVIKKDTDRYKEEAERERERIEYEIAEGEKLIETMQHIVAEKKEKIEELKRLLPK